MTEKPRVLSSGTMDSGDNVSGAMPSHEELPHARERHRMRASACWRRRAPDLVCASPRLAMDWNLQRVSASELHLLTKEGQCVEGQEGRARGMARVG